MLFASLNFALLNTLVNIYLMNLACHKLYFLDLFCYCFHLSWLLNAGLLSLKTKSYKLQLARSTVALAAMYLWFFLFQKYH